MSETAFDFDSGNLSLDYANTKVWHASEKPEERLNSYDDFLAWGEAAHLIAAEQASQLRQSGVEQPDNAASFFKHAIQVREAIYHIFSRRYAGEPLPARDLEVFNTVLRQAMAQLQIVSSGGEIRWDWAPETSAQNHVLWSVARAAAELLTSDMAGRVRECEDDRGCGYLFIDQSKNHSRRWCSMESCGNRAKARRHYSRVQEVRLSSTE